MTTQEIPTPRSDAEEQLSATPEIVAADFARQLERELAYQKQATRIAEEHLRAETGRLLRLESLERELAVCEEALKRIETQTVRTSDVLTCSRLASTALRRLTEMRGGLEIPCRSNNPRHRPSTTA